MWTRSKLRTGRVLRYGETYLGLLSLPSSFWILDDRWLTGRYAEHRSELAAVLCGLPTPTDADLDWVLGGGS